jgi:hypothetical protein
MKFKLFVIDLELSARAKRIAAAVVVPLLVLGGGAVAYANVPHSWADGDTLSAADLNGNFSALDQRVTTVEQAEATSEQQILARMKAGSNVSIPQGSNGTVAGGPVNPSATQMLWQAGSSVTGTDANGLGTVFYPTPFPNGVLSVIVVDGDANGPPHIMGLAGATNTTSFRTRVFDANGAPITNAGLVRYNWIAVGW